MLVLVLICISFLFVHLFETHKRRYAAAGVPYRLAITFGGIGSG